jgi:hypothetical protein
MAWEKASTSNGRGRTPRRATGNRVVSRAMLVSEHRMIRCARRSRLPQGLDCARLKASAGSMSEKVLGAALPARCIPSRSERHSSTSVGPEPSEDPIQTTASPRRSARVRVLCVAPAATLRRSSHPIVKPASAPDKGPFRAFGAAHSEPLVQRCSSATASTSSAISSATS